MADKDHIRNPVEWSVDQLRTATVAVGAAGQSVVGDGIAAAAPPAVRKITVADLREALARGVEDFVACRSDVVFLCIFYPLAGLVLARLAFGYEMLPLVFPLIAGFALLGPVASLGLYEMSRRREHGEVIGWTAAFGVLRSPAIGAIVVLGLILVALFAVWLLVAYRIYQATLGPETPASISAFVHDVFTTARGWAMILVGCGVGFVFAAVVLTMSVVSFPLLLDRDVGVVTAIGTSIRAVAANPVTSAVWGLVVAGGLVLGSLPALLGLVFVLPVLGHATWHLYRSVVLR